jgi:hypothetical protein
MSEPEDLHDPGQEEEDEDEDLSSAETNGHVNFGPAPSPTPQPPRQRAPRQRGRRGPAPGKDAWGESAGGKGTRVSALEVWPELLEQLKTNGKSPYDIAIRVVCEDPPPTRPIGNAFDASAVVGDRSTSPSDKLYQMVRDHYHMTWAKASCMYDIQFVWKSGGGIARRGSLTMPHPDEIVSQRDNENASRGRQSGGYPRQQWNDPPQPRQEDWRDRERERDRDGFGEPPRERERERGRDRETETEWRLRMDLERERENVARLQGQMNEVLAAVREGRMPSQQVSQTQPTTAPAPAPQAQPQVDLDGVVFRILDRMGFKPGVGTPPAAAQPAQPAAQPMQPQVDAVEAAVLKILGALGIKPGQPGIGVGAAPPPARNVVEETDAAVQGFEKMVASIVRMRGLGKKLDTIFGGGEVPVQPSEATAEVIDPEAAAGEGKLPFDAVAIPEVKWSDGRPVMYTADPKTGKVDWTAAAFSNPAVVEKVAEGFTRFMGTLGKVVQASMQGQQTGLGESEVVDDVPDDAQDANANKGGGGWGSGMG